MCLTTKQTEPLIAEEDIICYKFLDKKLHSPFYKFQYELGKLYKNEEEEVRITDYRLEFYFIEAGFYHAYLDKNPDNTFLERHDLYKCVIPKGTEYYIGHDGTEANPIAARAIIILEKLND